MTIDPHGSARATLEAARPGLVELSHRIHANPELGFEEVKASGWVADALDAAGFEVRRGYAGMDTAVVGTLGTGPLHLAICIEYDALPTVGHACGHNVICTAGLGAGLALAPLVDDLGLKLSMLGTPAEEGGGGKIGFIDAGYFADVHAAMMVHPFPTDEAEPRLIAVQQLSVSYEGRAAHAAGFPWKGVNAADAMVVAQTAIGLLRQQLQAGDLIHGYITKGGDAANIIPAHTTADYMIRASTASRLRELRELVGRCFEAGAVATGAELTLEEDVAYTDMRHDSELAATFQRHGEALGRTYTTPASPVSTDMGNVSYVVPSIHPMISIETHGAVNHQQEFADACAEPSADQAILDGALCLALTAIDAAQDETIRARLLGR
jgi:amidohydrolase